MRAILFGGPVDRRVIDDVPQTTEIVNIPAPLATDPKYAHYCRVGNGIDDRGPYLRFDFYAVHHGYPAALS